LLNKEETLQQLPGISDKKLKGGILYYDGQFDDARLAIELAVTAAKYGATILNYCAAKGFIKTEKKITGVIIEDTINHSRYEAKTKAVINATGVFADEVIHMDEPGIDTLVTPSQGIHVVVDKDFFPGTSALMIPKTDDGRVLFAVPWHDKVVLGTTDTPVDKISFEPKPLNEEVEFVLKHANRYLQKKITQSDVRSMFAGLRPLVKRTAAKKTSLLSRDHTIIVSKYGLITITGGKWTTYRKMAEDAVDNAVFVARLPKRDCITKHLIIGNKEDAYVKKDGNNFIHSLFHFTQKDIEWFIQKEMAITIEDVLARRTRLLFLDAHAAIDAAPSVAKSMAAVMIENEQWINEQVNSFTQLAKQYCIDK
jgi:glycerol-3-phosphate dehydrogenase